MLDAMKRVNAFAIAVNKENASGGPGTRLLYEYSAYTAYLSAVVIALGAVLVALLGKRCCRRHR